MLPQSQSGHVKAGDTSVVLEPCSPCEGSKGSLERKVNNVL